MINRIFNVEINWAKPIAVDNRFNSAHYDEQIGIYLISTKFTRNGVLCEKFVYVGETMNSFDTRIFQHIEKSSEWSKSYGQKYIRFGKIEKYPNWVETKELLLTLESTIIQSIKDHPNARLVNKRQINSWTIYYDINVENVGYRGIVPPELCTRDYYEE
ncbi:hypothetical protein [Sodaliphilus sp.]|uniref:hypothetical protein n=1 Tax=Sodaliphilus sp. TaxID=2815818 RepID=UPI00388D6900